MPRIVTITKTLYQYDELPTEQAKEKAREWYRRVSDEFNDLLDSNIDDFKSVAKILGIEFAQREIQIVRTGKIRYEPKVYYSGFWSQGDGASFDGYYSYAADAPKKIREYAPKDETLASIADELEAIQAKHSNAISAKTKVSGNYCHSGCMEVECFYEPTSEDVDAENSGDEESNGEKAFWNSDAEKEIRTQLRAFADWMYRQLESDYNWRMEKEQVEDSIRANEYEFTEDGKRDNGNA